MAFSEMVSGEFTIIQDQNSSQIREKNICNLDDQVTQIKMTKAELVSLS